MLQDAPVPLLLDVLQVVAGGPVGRIVLAHVAQPPGELCEPLTVRAVAYPRHAEVIRGGEGGTSEHGDAGLVVEVRCGGGGSSHERGGRTD